MNTKAEFSGPWTHNQPTQVDPNTFKFDCKGFTAYIDVHSFEPKEISVKTIDHAIVVECKHNSREVGHELVEGRFVRKFNLPNEYDMSTVKSTLSMDGVLQLEVPKPLHSEPEHIEVQNPEKPSFLMSLLSNRANSMLRRSHSSDIEDE